MTHLGGTIGLFTGMSLLSIVEIFYWAFIIVMGIPNNPPPNKREDKTPKTHRIYTA